MQAQDLGKASQWRTQFRRLTAWLRRRSQGEKAWAQGVDEILEKKEEKEDIRPRPLFCQLGVDDCRQRFSGKSGTEKGALP